MSLGSHKPIRPIAKQLEERLGGKWKAVRDGFGWMWQSDDGREVRAYSALTPQHDGDDETCMTVYCDNTGRQIGAGGIIYG